MPENNINYLKYLVQCEKLQQLRVLFQGFIWSNGYTCRYVRLISYIYIASSTS